METRHAINIHVGTIELGTVSSNRLIVRPEGSGADLRRHCNTPWMRAWALRELGPPSGRVNRPAVQARPQNRSVEVSTAALEHHAFLLGSTGSGKSRLALHLLTEQLKAGCSAVVLDPKSETIEHVLACSREAGLRPDQIVLLRPGVLDEGVPGWNPLRAELPIHLAAVDLVSVLEKSTTSWGPRLADILTNSLVVLAAYGLSLFELPQLLTNDEYRKHLLEQRPTCDEPQDLVAFNVAHSFLAAEFSAWSKADRMSAIAPVLNKTRELLRSAFLQALLCAQDNTVSLGSLWQQQMVVLVHLDSAVLGEEGARILSGFMAHQLHRTAMRCGHASRIPVVLCVDELGLQESFLGSALKSILAIARSKNLRLLTAFQHFTQLSPELREALLSQCAVQGCFRLGYADARIMAQTLTSGEPDRIVRVGARLAEIDKITGLPKRVLWRHKVCDGNGKPLAVEPLAWQMLLWHDILAPIRSRNQQARHAPPLFVPPDAAGKLRKPQLKATQHAHLSRVRKIAAYAGITRMYVIAPDSGEPVDLESYVACLSDDEYWFAGPSPLTLVVSFPRPAFVRPQRLRDGDRMDEWIGHLMKLPKQHAVIRTHSQKTNAPAFIRVVDVLGSKSPAEGNGSLASYIQASLDANACRWSEIQVALTRREAEIEQIASGRPAEPLLPTHKQPIKAAIMQIGGPSQVNTFGPTRGHQATRAEAPEGANLTLVQTAHEAPDFTEPKPTRRANPVTMGKVAADGSLA